MKELEKMKQLCLYGEIDYLTDGEKINLIEKYFKKGTIKGSAISGELRILNEKYGMYEACNKNWQLCEITHDKDNPFGNSYYFAKIIEELTLDKLFEIVNDDNLKKEYEEKYNERMSKNRFYYEIELNHKTSYGSLKYVHFYLEANDKCFEFNLDKTGYIEFLSGDFEISSRYGDLNETLENIKDDEVKKYLIKGITTIENGYIYKNRYYEDFESIKEKIKEELKEENNNE